MSRAAGVFRRSPALLLCLLLLGGLAAGRDGAALAAASRPAARKIRQLRERLKILQSREHLQRVELRQTKRSQARLADQLNESFQQVEDANRALADAARQVALAERKVRATERRLADAERDLQRQQDEFGNRLSLAYMEGPVSISDVLLGASDLTDFMDRKYYVEQIAENDAELLRLLREAQERVERERDALLREKAELENIERRRALALQTAQEKADEQERLLQAMRAERALQEQRLAELEEDSAEVERDLSAELIRRQAMPGGGSLPRWSGALYRPADGPVTSGFGYRTHPLLRYRRMHSGIDIGAPSGSPVYAAADGEVYFASWRGGYGQCIILLHGSGMQTLYGHLSSIHVSSGQRVRRGQRIGAVGSTGLSTGPHLHFELRRNGVPVNPR